MTFTFEQELEDESLRWVAYENGCYVPFEVPPVGEAIALDAVSFDLFAPPDAANLPRRTPPS